MSVTSLLSRLFRRRPAPIQSEDSGPGGHIRRVVRRAKFDVFVADEPLPGSDVIALIQLTPAEGESHTIVVWQGHSMNQAVTQARAAGITFLLNHGLTALVELSAYSDGIVRRPDGTALDHRMFMAPLTGRTGKRIDELLLRAPRSTHPKAGEGRFIAAASWSDEL